MKILVLGADGYIGWPLSMRLARCYPHASLTLVDNGGRRRWVDEMGGNSVTPIRTLEERVEAFGRHNPVPMRIVRVDVTTDALDHLIAEVQPDVVYHLAQLCSAPYSMASVDHGLRTVANNELGNLRLLFALRAHAPQAHLVKLGTFGEYAKGGIDIAEGYFEPEYNGKRASRPLPYPRESDDIYHITKINDTNFISLACRKWGLAITDVMQSTIYGLHTEDTALDPALCTRFDYDAVWGTVVNRFIAQTVMGLPMSVYGSGFQRTGLMALADSVYSLAAMAPHKPEAGVHRVINHVTERDHCIRDIAERVRDVAHEQGFAAEVRLGDHNPRQENDAQKADYRIEAPYVDHAVTPSPMHSTIGPLFASVAAHRDRVRTEVFAPRVLW